MSIVPPIVVAVGSAVNLYRTVSDVEEHVEEWVPAGGYRAFDAEGLRLELVPEDQSVVVRATESDPSGADDLAALLRAWLPTVGVPVGDDEHLTLAELLERATERIGFT